LAEDAACAHLRAKGYRIVARNWRCRFGELDVIARDGDILAIVEVKLRRSAGFGGPEGALSRAKRDRILAATGAFLARTGCRLTVRFDVVAIEGADLRHHQDAFRAESCLPGS
jgi:putative endonuclease